MQPDDKLEQRGRAQDGASKVEGEFGKKESLEKFGKFEKYTFWEDIERRNRLGQSIQGGS